MTTDLNKLQEMVDSICDDFMVVDVLKAVSYYMDGLEGTASDETLFKTTADIINDCIWDIEKLWKEWEG